MTTFTSLCIAGATALALTSGVAAPSMAQETLVNLVTGQTDPFEVSKQRCIDNGWMNSSCITANEASGSFPIQLLIDDMNTSIERIRQKNGWGEEVTPETMVPIGATFAFG